MRERIEDTWLIDALSIGVKECDFWGMNPHKMKIYMQAYNKELQRKADYDNQLSHLQGMYFVEALRATVGNMFSSKGSKPYEYPKKPYSSNDELTEDKKQKQREMLMMSLQAMASNFNLHKQEKENK